MSCRCPRVSLLKDLSWKKLTRTATVQKIVSEILQSEPGMTFAKDSRDVLIDCCVEFITLISSEANEIAEKEAKKTIACEHVKHALEELDFGAYVPAVLEVAENYKNQQQVRGTLADFYGWGTKCAERVR
jgi:histone H3/H4